MIRLIRPCIFLLLCGCGNGSAWQGKESIYDDDYCDLEDGSDEPHTSACSGRPGAPKFLCRGSGVLNVSIPLSRVQDGVCDCCDGEDEENSPNFQRSGQICPNRCSEELLSLKTDTLGKYKHISAGLRAKTDLLNALNRKKLREKQSYDGLLSEYSEIQKLYYQIKYWLERDSKVESSLQFKELRSRVRKCADGFFESCDYFGDGSNTMYSDEESDWYDFPELWDEQGPLPEIPKENEDFEDDLGKNFEGDLGKKSKLGNSPHRKKYESVSEQIEEVIKKNKAKDRINSQLNGAQRIENSFCAFEEMDKVGLLGGEESLRVHKNVKQYLTWVSGRGGQAYRKLTTEQMRKKNTLFGAYLDSGTSGHELGLQVLCEAMGMLLAPVTVTYTHLTSLHSRLVRSFFQRAQSCVLEVDGEDGYRRHWYRNKAEADDFQWIPCNAFTVTVFRGVLQAATESSWLSRILAYLDYNNYDWFMTVVVNRAAPYINSNLWYFRIIQQTPYYYYHFYLGGGKSKLPVYRNACILREGLRVATVELEDIKAKVKEKRRQVEAEGGVVDMEVGADGKLSSKDTAKTSNTLFSFSSSKEKAPGDSFQVDFGPDGGWQAVNDTCLTRREGGYSYKVCLFQSVYQDNTRLGSFFNWGKKPRESGTAGQAESKMFSFKNRIQKGRNKKKAEVSDNLATVTTTDGSENEANATYTSHYYGGGVSCHNGIIRHAIVEFDCAPFSEITDIVEYEMCGYMFKVNTPLACTRDMEESTLRMLQKLDVYGYSSKEKEVSSATSSASLDDDRQGDVDDEDERSSDESDVTSHDADDEDEKSSDETDDTPHDEDEDEKSSDETDDTSHDDDEDERSSDETDDTPHDDDEDEKSSETDDTPHDDDEDERSSDETDVNSHDDDEDERSSDETDVNSHDDDEDERSSDKSHITSHNDDEEDEDSFESSRSQEVEVDVVGVAKLDSLETARRKNRGSDKDAKKPYRVVFNS